MDKKRILSLFAAITSLLNIQAQVSVFNPSVTADGINYVLPKTVLSAEVSAMKTIYTPGEYAKYADRYLQLNSSKGGQEVHWKITDVEVYQTGTPDTLKRFSVKAKDKNLLPKVQLDEMGIILSINRKYDVSPREEKKEWSTNHKLDYKKYLNEEMLSATSTSKMAELIAHEILDIRDSKNAIRRGQVESMPKDGPSLKIVLDQLDAQEEALTQLFVGYTDTIYSSRTYSVVLDGEVDKDVLFRFSNKLGFVDADDLSGEPYYISVKDLHTVNLPTEKEASKRKIMGIVYNVPGMASVTLKSSDKTYFEHDLPFAQFGTVDVLSSTLLKNDVTTKVTYNQATGAVSLLE